MNTDDVPDLTPSENHFADADAEPANKAVWFFDLGIRVFPLIGKRPDSMRHYPERYPRCFSWDDYSCTRSHVERFENYAVPLEHLIVVDTDSIDVEAWVTSFLPSTPFRVCTARGKHRYFRRTGPLPSFIKRDGFTIESRNRGEYVVGPGSVHVTGIVYTAEPWSWRLHDVPIFPSDFLFDDGSCGSSSTSGVSGERFEFPTAVYAGERHRMLFRQLRSWRHIFTKEEAYEMLKDLNAVCCKPPLSVDARSSRRNDPRLSESFDHWFERSWKQKDRPFPDVLPTPVGYDRRTLRRLGLRL